MRVSACSEVAQARIVTTSPDIFDAAGWQAFDRLSRRCAMRRFGGDCYGYAQLAGGTIDLVVDDAELERRRAGLKHPEPRYTTGVLAKYARLVTGAERGAVTEP